MRAMRVAEGQTTQYDIDGVPVASLPPDIPRFEHKREGESNQYYLELILRFQVNDPLLQSLMVQ